MNPLKSVGLRHGCPRPHHVLSSCFGIPCMRDLHSPEISPFLCKKISLGISGIWVTASLLLESQAPSTFEEEHVFMA